MISFGLVRRSLAALTAAASIGAMSVSTIASAGSEFAPRSASGTLSVVTLVDVSRLPPELLRVALPGAEDGLVFLFLIVKQPGADGVPTLREPRDFRIDRASYHKRTVAALGAAIAPVTFLEDAKDFLARVNPSAGTPPPIPEGEAYVMVTTIGGARLPERGEGELEVEVGFGGATETMPFRFAVPPPVAVDAPEVPSVPGEPAPRPWKEPMLST